MGVVVSGGVPCAVVCAIIPLRSRSGCSFEKVSRQDEGSNSTFQKFPATNLVTNVRACFIAADALSYDTMVRRRHGHGHTVHIHTDTEVHGPFDRSTLIPNMVAAHQQQQLSGIRS